MAKSKKIVAILPAYNAAKTLNSFFKNFPFKLFNEVILVDDFSSDNTLEVMRRIRRIREERGIRVFRNQTNLGYGGNLKKCLGLALESGADVIVEIHPDGEYGFEGIVQVLRLVQKGAGMVLGNRFGKYPAKGISGWKVPVTKALTAAGNFVLKTKIPDMHQGFRVYTADSLKRTNYRNFSNNYLFSFQIIAETALKKVRIDSVSVSTKYEGKKRGAGFKSSVIYSLGVLGSLLKIILLEPDEERHDSITCPNCQTSFLTRFVLTQNGFNLYFCDQCRIGFTNPVPKTIDKYYYSNYWKEGSIIGQIKQKFFAFFQLRRAKWIRKELTNGGRVLDVGSGEGLFGNSMKGNFKVLSIEPAFSKVKNPEVLKKDFLKFNPKEKFDAITFWESLEHVSSPGNYLKQAGNLLKQNGKVFIEYPVFNSFEAGLFKSNWFHLDLPRHLTHFTESGLIQVSESQGFRVTEKRRILALEYCVWGFFSSLMKEFGLPADRFKLSKVSIVLILILSPLIFLSFILELILYTINQSPIGLIILQKE